MQVSVTWHISVLQNFSQCTEHVTSYDISVKDGKSRIHRILFVNIQKHFSISGRLISSYSKVLIRCIRWLHPQRSNLQQSTPASWTFTFKFLLVVFIYFPYWSQFPLLPHKLNILGVTRKPQEVLLSENREQLVEQQQQKRLWPCFFSYVPDLHIEDLLSSC